MKSAGKKQLFFWQRTCLAALLFVVLSTICSIAQEFSPRSIAGPTQDPFTHQPVITPIKQTTILPQESSLKLELETPLPLQGARKLQPTVLVIQFKSEASLKDFMAQPLRQLIIPPSENPSENQNSIFIKSRAGVIRAELSSDRLVKTLPQNGESSSSSSLPTEERKPFASKPAR